MIQQILYLIYIYHSFFERDHPAKIWWITIFNNYFIFNDSTHQWSSSIIRRKIMIVITNIFLLIIPKKIMQWINIIIKPRFIKMSTFMICISIGYFNFMKIENNPNHDGAWPFKTKNELNYYIVWGKVEGRICHFDL